MKIISFAIAIIWVSPLRADVGTKSAICSWEDVMEECHEEGAMCHSKEELCHGLPFHQLNCECVAYEDGTLHWDCWDLPCPPLPRTLSPTSVPDSSEVSDYAEAKWKSSLRSVSKGEGSRVVKTEA